MKKVISIILSVIVVLSAVSFGLYTYTLNYNYTPEYDRLKDVLAGYSKDMTTITEYETDYYNLLESRNLKCLNFFEATSVIMTSTKTPSLTFASSEIFDSKNYDSIFFLGSVIIKNDKPYLYVAYITDGRIAHSLYLIDSEDFIEQTEQNDFKEKNITSAIIHDCFSSLYLFAMKHGVVLITLAVIIIAAVLFLKKQKKQQQG